MLQQNFGSLLNKNMGNNLGFNLYTVDGTRIQFQGFTYIYIYILYVYVYIYVYVYTHISFTLIYLGLLLP